MVATSIADPTNAVEVAALLKESAEAGTAVEAMRIVFSTTAGAEFVELLGQQLDFLPEGTAPSLENSTLTKIAHEKGTRQI